MINAFVQFIQSFYGLQLQEVNKAVAKTANPLHYPVFGIGLKGSMIDSDLACSHFGGNE